MTKTNSQHFARRCLVLLLAFAVIFTYVPQEAFAGSQFRAGSKVYFVNGNVLEGKDGKPYGGYVSNASRHAYAIKPIGGGKTIRGYCLERDVMNPSNGSTKYTANDPTKFFDDMGNNKSRAIALALLYGKQPDYSYSDMEKMLGVSRDDVNMDDWWLATQLIIWEFEQGIRKSVDTIPANVSAKKLGTVAAGGEPADFHFNIIKGRPAAKIYFAMLKAMRVHKLVPSFTEQAKSKAKTIFMEETSAGVWKSVNSKYAGIKDEAEKEAARQNADYYVLTDTKASGSALKVMKNAAKDSAYTFTQNKAGGNKYTLTYKGSTLPTATKHGKKNIPETTDEDLLVWQSSGYQTIATGADDPVDFYFKMKPLGTNLETGEDPEFFPELQFPVHKDDLNEGWDGDNCTGMGDASLGSTFELYRDGNLVDSITLDAYGETDYLSDIPWQEASDFVKTESGSKAHDNSGTNHCTVTPTLREWEATTTYTIKEIPADGRLPEKVVNTRTYTVNYYAKSVNSQECMNDEQSWGRINYNVEFVDNGTSTTVSGTVESGAVLMDYTHEFDVQTYVNDNYRGLLEIIKTKNDLNPYTQKEDGVKTESVNSKWTIELKSGGYEENPYIRVVPLTSGEANYDVYPNLTKYFVKCQR
ncbi:hypothetical protein M2140_000405 [Clostridiales Family XIII bacterium PM5-7]